MLERGLNPVSGLSDMVTTNQTHLLPGKEIEPGSPRLGANCDDKPYAGYFIPLRLDSDDDDFDDKGDDIHNDDDDNDVFEFYYDDQRMKTTNPVLVYDDLTKTIR
ncbi:hypothetical protein DPMN_075543 [Dreissena polymorpha]|uniref:Uncharacterized protein n=1 Tax=Dreissena polymorpha TaxID=45954 RepID=A0A9D4BLL8_DREPO|nr:hypothetical protein DPMN_075543 [Dreissena polymorpha]